MRIPGTQTRHDRYLSEAAEISGSGWHAVALRQLHRCCRLGCTCTCALACVGLYAAASIICQCMQLQGGPVNGARRVACRMHGRTVSSAAAREVSTAADSPRRAARASFSGRLALGLQPTTRTQANTWEWCEWESLGSAAARMMYRKASVGSCSAKRRDASSTRDLGLSKTLSCTSACACVRP